MAMIIRSFRQTGFSLAVISPAEVALSPTGQIFQFWLNQAAGLHNNKLPLRNQIS